MHLVEHQQSLDYNALHDVIGPGHRPSRARNGSAERKCRGNSSLVDSIISDVRGLLKAETPRPETGRKPAVMSQAEFCRLAKDDVPSLTLIVEDRGVPAEHLTFAAEAVGLVQELTPRLQKALLELLQHDKPYVREGALYGLAPHIALSQVRDRVKQVAEDDPTAEIREVAAEVLQC